MYERILLAIDTSEHSRKAVNAAAGIASQFQSAEMLVVHVREPRLAETGDHLETEAEAAELAEWAAEVLRAQACVPRSTSATAGREAWQVPSLAAARDFHPGLIIMGSRGLTELKGLLLGSVSHKVIQLAVSPVPVVR